MTEPNDPTELAGVADADTQSAYAWGSVDDSETDDIASLQGRRASPRLITITAVLASLAVVIGVAVFGGYKLASRPSAAPQTSAVPSPVAGVGSSPSKFAAPAPDPNRVPNGNCPPACTHIPDSAWVAPSPIPLDDVYSWPQLAPLSEAVTSPRFEMDYLCAAPPVTDDQRDVAVAAHIMLPNPPGQWQLSVQIVHWRGDPWIAGQHASAVMDNASAVLKNECSSPTAGAIVSGVAEQFLPGGHPGQSLIATITVGGPKPVVAHEYLVSDLRNSTVVELAMWSTDPASVDWPAVDGDKLLADMVAPLCTAYVNSCN